MTVRLLGLKLNKVIDYELLDDTQKYSCLVVIRKFENFPKHIFTFPFEHVLLKPWRTFGIKGR